MTTPYTHVPIDDVRDAAPDFGAGDIQQIRFANDALETEQTGFTHHRLEPGVRPNFAHRHQEAEEIYVVLSGSGRLRLDDEIVELEPMDAVRVAAKVTRAFEADDEGLEILAFGRRHEGDGEIVPDFWT